MLIKSSRRRLHTSFKLRGSVSRQGSDYEIGVFRLDKGLENGRSAWPSEAAVVSVGKPWQP